VTDLGGSGVTSDAHSSRWIDISRPISPQISVWPGDLPFELHRTVDGEMVVSRFATTCHVGTHVDAPLHLDPSAGAVESIPLERLIGRAEIIRVAPLGELVDRDRLPAGWSPGARRLLIRTDSHPLDAPISEGFAGLDPSLVEWLADFGVELVGIDTPSVDPFGAEPLCAHQALLARGMTWLEGLYLDGVDAGEYEMVALPLLLVGADAAPTRVVVRRLAAKAGKR